MTSGSRPELDTAEDVIDMLIRRERATKLLAFAIPQVETRVAAARP